MPFVVTVFFFHFNDSKIKKKTLKKFTQYKYDIEIYIYYPNEKNKTFFHVSECMSDIDQYINQYGI